MQVLGEEWRRVALDYQAKVHRVAIIILKAIFIGLGRDEGVIDEVHTMLFFLFRSGPQCRSCRLERPVPAPSR